MVTGSVRPCWRNSWRTSSRAEAGLLEPGGEIELGGCCALQVNGHQGRSAALGQFDEAGLPGAILHPLGTEAGDPRLRGR